MTFRLRLLGGAAIESEAGAPLVGAVAQRRRLALLALLAAAPAGAMSRERLATFLFHEKDDDRAHKGLADALHAVRKALGRDALTAAGDELRLNPQLVASDVAAFEAALASGDDERAVALYQGPFLNGFFVPDAPEFEQWVEAERQHLARVYAQALDALATGCQARGDVAGAVRWWRARAAHDPLDSRTAARLVSALADSGDPAGALRHAAVHRALLREELEIEPPLEFNQLEAQVRARPVVQARQVERAPVAPTAPTTPAAAPAAAVAEGVRRTSTPEPAARTDIAPPHGSGRRRWARAGLLAVAVATTVFAASGGFTRTPPPVGASPATVVIFPLAPHGDGAVPPLAAELTELLSRSLDGAGELRIVDPATVARQVDLGLRADGTPRPLDLSRATRIAARLGASRFVLGSVSANGDRARVRLALHDSTGALAAPEVAAEGYTGNVFRLADELTASLLERTIGAASARVARSAVLTTGSAPALREFLRGEHALRRAHYDSAIAHFQRAVALDSTFALAYYRLAVASGLYDREPDVSVFAIEGAAPTALDRALANADRLPERDRRLLVGYAAFRRGRADEAEGHYLALLRDYPDDVEARFQLAEVRFRYNALRGRHPNEAAEDYRRVLSYDPGFFCPI